MTYSQTIARGNSNYLIEFFLVQVVFLGLKSFPPEINVVALGRSSAWSETELTFVIIHI